MLFTAAGFSHASTDTLTQTAPAGPNRPANVPENFVITPFGYFDPACVRTLANEEHIRQDGHLQHADGTVEASAVSCSQPHFLKDGLRIDPGNTNAKTGAPSQAKTAKTNPTINGWVESGSVTTGSESSSYGAITAYFTVPRKPASDDGQTDYYFPGLEDIGNTHSILQPVLGYYDGKWTIASWNCCMNGVTTNSKLVQVHPGDTIYGTVRSNCAAGTLSCSTWNIDTQDQTTGAHSALKNTPSKGQIFNWAFGGVLEVYGVKTCDDLPPDGQTTFDQINLYDQYDNVIGSPKWEADADKHDTTPSCNYHVTMAPQAVTVAY